MHAAGFDRTVGQHGSDIARRHSVADRSADVPGKPDRGFELRLGGADIFVCARSFLNCANACIVVPLRGVFPTFGRETEGFPLGDDKGSPIGPPLTSLSAEVPDRRSLRAPTTGCSTSLRAPASPARPSWSSTRKRASAGGSFSSNLPSPPATWGAPPLLTSPGGGWRRRRPACRRPGLTRSAP